MLPKRRLLAFAAALQAATAFVAPLTTMVAGAAAFKTEVTIDMGIWGFDSVLMHGDVDEARS